MSGFIRLQQVTDREYAIETLMSVDQVAMVEGSEIPAFGKEYAYGARITTTHGKEILVRESVPYIQSQIEEAKQ